MVTITDYKERVNNSGEKFLSLILQGGIEMVKSKETGNFYATAKKTSITSTFKEEYCKALIGTTMSGSIKRVECEEYEYTVQETGELVRLSHRWEYFPEGENEEEVVFEGTPIGHEHYAG
jgi:hypothetical protein